MSKAAAESRILSQALEPGERDFMQRAQVTNEMMNEMRRLVNSKGLDFIGSILNGNPTAQAIRAKTDPDYARMLVLMNQLRGQSVRALEGGRPSNFDLNILNNAPAPGDTKQSALAKLDQAQRFLANQYVRDLPAYTMSLQSLPDIPQVVPRLDSHQLTDSYDGPKIALHNLLKPLVDADLAGQILRPFDLPLRVGGSWIFSITFLTFSFNHFPPVFGKCQFGVSGLRKLMKKRNSTIEPDRRPITFSLIRSGLWAKAETITKAILAPATMLAVWIDLPTVVISLNSLFV